MAALHVDPGVLGHEAEGFVGNVTEAGAIDGAFDGTCLNRYLGVTMHLAELAAAEEVTLDEEALAVGHIGMHVDVGVGGDKAVVDACHTTLAAAVDITVDMAVAEVDEGVGVVGVGSCGVGVIGGEVAAAIDGVDLKAAACIGGVDDDGDAALDVTVNVAAAIDVADGAAAEDDGDVAAGAIQGGVILHPGTHFVRVLTLISGKEFIGIHLGL